MVASCDRAGSWFEVVAGKSVPGFSRNAPEDDPPRPAKCFAFVQAHDDRPRRRLLDVLAAQGYAPNQKLVLMSDGGESVRQLVAQIGPETEHVLDWFHVTMRLTVLRQMTRGACPTDVGWTEQRLRDLERLKWLLWHGHARQAVDAAQELADDAWSREEDAKEEEAETAEARGKLRRRLRRCEQPASCGAPRGRATTGRRGCPSHDDGAQCGWIQAAVLDIAPAIDLAEHRPVATVRSAQPVLQRVHRAGGEMRLTRQVDHVAARVSLVTVHEGEFKAIVGEAHLLGLEAEQGGAGQRRDGCGWRVALCRHARLVTCAAVRPVGRRRGSAPGGSRSSEGRVREQQEKRAIANAGGITRAEHRCTDELCRARNGERQAD